LAFKKNKPEMKAASANLLNAVVLIAAGVYGYFGIAAADGSHSLTALIPAAFGVLFLILQKGVAAANKAIAHIVVVLTLVLLVMCIMRFMKVEEWNEKKYIFLACIITNAIALIAFIGSFIAARKNRQP
jgi:heme/copper-type cytochrome/quinol oxidase subunit 4